ncbi:MAG: glycosyltransferase family 2 protein [Gammaproteobacteria bacterium]|nr:glycosyltransferase family 2 protein [Gammaproteobacteria bacterium]
MNQQLSVFVTTFNNARTLERCLASVDWADEIVVLDSFSSDDSVAIAERHGARVYQHEFLGYGRQKQLALDKTRHDWVLLLDADEMLSPALADEIRALMLSGPSGAGYELPRAEQLFWRINHAGVRLNYHLRLFDKRRGRMSDMPVHAVPTVTGEVSRLQNVFYHFGEIDIHAKVEKINAYSTGLVADKVARGRRASPATLIFYPPFVFVQAFVFKRGFLDGWAGFISSVVMAFYAFLKYAKLYERARFESIEEGSLPPGIELERPVRDEVGRLVEFSAKR